MKFQLRVRPDSWRFRIVLGLTLGAVLFGAILLVSAPFEVALAAGLVTAIVGPLIVDVQLRSIPPEVVAAQNARIVDRIEELEGE